MEFSMAIGGWAAALALPNDGLLEMHLRTGMIEMVEPSRSNTLSPVAHLEHPIGWKLAAVGLLPAERTWFAATDAQAATRFTAPGHVGILGVLDNQGWLTKPDGDPPRALLAWLAERSTVELADGLARSRQFIAWATITPITPPTLDQIKVP